MRKFTLKCLCRIGSRFFLLIRKKLRKDWKEANSELKRTNSFALVNKQSKCLVEKNFSKKSIFTNLALKLYLLVTDPIFRLPLPTLFFWPKAVHLGDGAILPSPRRVFQGPGPGDTFACWENFGTLRMKPKPILRATLGMVNYCPSRKVVAYWLVVARRARGPEFNPRSSQMSLTWVGLLHLG